MKILMVCPQFAPLFGGYEIAAARLSAALVRRNHQVTVVTERRNPMWPRSEIKDGVRIWRLPCLFVRRLHTLSSAIALALYLLLHGRRFHVWHVHQYGISAAITIVLGKVLQRPVVLKITSSGPQGLMRALAALPFSEILLSIHRKADLTIAPSVDAAQETLAANFPPSKVKRIPNGVDIDVFAPRSSASINDLKARLGVSEPKVIIFVGRLSAEKNVGSLIRAMNLIVSNLSPDWCLLIVGDGDERGALTELAVRLGILERIRFLGSQSNVAEWLAISNLYVLCSRNEGLSNTMLEAMATGLPVVTTPVSGVRELVEESGGGLVVGQASDDELAKGLLTLVASDTLRTEMGVRARERIIDEYSLDSVVTRFEGIYSEVMVAKKQDFV